MEKENLNPISGDHFEDFLLLTDPKEKSLKTKQAWQTLQKQIKSILISDVDNWSISALDSKGNYTDPYFKITNQKKNVLWILINSVNHLNQTYHLSR